jgi:cephalosporin hydroxylase
MENGNHSGKRHLSQSSVNLVVALYFLLGLGIGWLWKEPLSLVDLFHPPRNAIEAFHQWYYDHFDATWQNTSWLGVQVDKVPLDLWVYQEIISETNPDVLIEAGTYKGGSALFFASVFDALKHGRVLSIDIVAYPNRPQHPRITYLLGSSTSEAIFQKIKGSIRPGETVMVSLDSDHHKAHVLEELKLYSSLVTIGNYLVVEDTDINGHPVYPTFGPGPMEAVMEFLKTNSNFEQDRSREKFGFTAYPGGWLKRVR